MKNVFYVNKIYYYTLILYLMSDTTAHKGGGANNLHWKIQHRHAVYSRSSLTYHFELGNVQQLPAHFNTYTYLQLVCTCAKSISIVTWQAQETNFFFFFLETHLCSSGNQYKKSASKLRTEQRCTGFFTGIFVHRARSLYFLLARRSKSRWTPWTRMHHNV